MISSRTTLAIVTIPRTALATALLGLACTCLGSIAQADSTRAGNSHTGPLNSSVARLGNTDSQFARTDITHTSAGDTGTADAGFPHAGSTGSDFANASSAGTGSIHAVPADTGASFPQPDNTTQPAAAAHTAAPTYSAAGLYNLANSYARAGKPGMAVLNYERARLLAPNDRDIEANLRWVRSSAKLPSDPPTPWERAVTMASPTTLSWIGLSGLLIAGGSLLAGRAYPRWLRRIGLLLGIALIGLTVGNAIALWPRLHEAVVLTNATPVRVSPVPMGDPAFVLPEAETVHITAEHEGFVLIRTQAGRTGWIANANLAPVVPRP